MKGDIVDLNTMGAWFAKHIICITIAGLFIAFILIEGFREKRCDAKSNNCNEKYCTKLKEHDYKYCIAGLIFVIVFISTLTMGQDKDINQSISFASTISSIILSILAIIMTLLAESKSDNVQYRMDQFISKINDYNQSNNKQLRRIEAIAKKFDSLEEYLNKIIAKEDQIIAKQAEMQDQMKFYNDKTVDINISERQTDNKPKWGKGTFENKEQDSVTEGENNGQRKN